MVAPYPQWSGSVCVIDTSYRIQKNGGTVVELFARSRDGYSLTILVHGLRPHVVISTPDSPSSAILESRLSKVRDDDRVTDVHEPRILWSENGEKPHWRVDVSQPNIVPKLREVLRKEWIVSSSDIVFPLRLFLDRDVGPHIEVSGDVIWAQRRAPSDLLSNFPEFTPQHGESIREAGGSGLYPTDMILSCNLNNIVETEAFRTPFVTASFDLETSVINPQILCAAMVIDRDGERTEYAIDGPEKEILSRLTRIIQDEDPDIITGYNIDNFDLPRIDQRTSDLGGSSDEFVALEMFGWSRRSLRDGKRGLPSRNQSRRWNITGRCVMDAWWEARMALRPQRESLRFVAELLFPERPELRKMEIDASKMDEEWKNRPDEVLRYCVMDTILPLEILDAIHAIRSKEALASVSKIPIQRAISGTTSQWIDSLMIRLADRENIAVPQTRNVGRSDQIAGGHVQDVESGLHPWVAVLDFKSMYPSIMIEQNICFTTRIDSKNAPENGVNIAPDGTTYLDRTHRIGLVPRLLQDLMNERDKQKEAMKKAKSKGDLSLEKFHDRMQYAVKILMNSFYGVFASSFYRFTHPEIGASITSWARSNIQSVISTLESEKQRVVYGDTDSIFISSPVPPGTSTRIPDEEDETRSDFEDAREITIRFGQDLARRFSKSGAELEFEAALAAMFSHGAKKRYFGQVVWPEEDLLIRGYEVRRSDSFVLLTQCMMSSFELILAGETTKAVDDIRSLIQNVRDRNVEPRDLVISRSCKGHLRSDGSVYFTKAYKNPDSMPYVSAAKSRIARGLNFTPGMKVGYLVTDASNSPMTVIDWHEDETGETQTDFDPEYYAKRIATAMGRITEVFGWNEKDLLQGSKQGTLDSWL